MLLSHLHHCSMVTAIMRLCGAVQGGWKLERSSYVSVQQMVASLRLGAEPVTQKSGAILKTPVPRPDWMLSNDDVELQLKIGSVRRRVAFYSSL